ncbi:hypothetical protein J8C01_03375 [Chloracidobacterium sp. D]|nr:hypothetical protein [Chloracidobacterium sp. D]QUV82379.1 hypothetical protein J8C01_03375 [Chloracidobacterium sp. D]
MQSHLAEPVKMQVRYYRYISDQLGEGRILVKNVEAFLAVNPQAQISTNVTAPLFRVSLNQRQVGLKPRGVELVEFDPSSGSIISRLFVPVTTPSDFENIQVSQSYLINGKGYGVHRKRYEVIGR